MIAGLALFSLPVGIIANGFVTGLSRRRFAITWNMLRRQPLFQDMDIESLTDVLEIPTASIIRDHAHPTVEGKEAEEFYVIVAGVARAKLSDRERDLGPGDIIGAEALHHLTKYTRTVTAETDMRVMAFPAEELRRLCRKYPVLRHRVEIVLEKDGGRAKTEASRTEALENEVRDLQRAIAAMMLEKHVS